MRAFTPKLKLTHYPELFALVFGFGLGADFMLIPLMAAQVAA
jgi:hypothetical protein